jgi:hypothetical protein
MNLKIKINKAIRLVNKIEKIRSKNNKNWMNLLKLSLKLDLKETSKILKQICKEDKSISNIANKIYKLK